MIRRNGMRLAMLITAVGLIAVLPASAAAKPQAKAKVKVSDEPFLLTGDAIGPDEAIGAAACPRKTTLLGGGAVSNTPVPSGSALSVELFRSGPLFTKNPVNAWFVWYDNDAPVNLQPSAQAICIKDELKTTGIEGSPKAISKVKRVNTPFTLPTADPPTFGIGQVDVPCPKGTTIAGGGAWLNADEVGVRLYETGPQGNGWRVRIDSDSGTPLTAIATAFCLKDKLKVEGEGEKAGSKFEQVDQTVTLPPNTTNIGRARFTVPCPKGTKIVGGGGKLDPAAPLATTDVQLEESGAVGNAWQVTFENEEAVAQSASVHAICLKKKLEVK